MSAPSVLVVGDLLLDVVARPAGPLRVGSDVASTNRIGGGGSAANTATWLAHAGVDVHLLAATGDDAVGAQLRAEMTAAGVASTGPIVPGQRSGTCVVLVGPDGERTMLPDRGANEALRPEHLAGAVGRAGGGLAAVHVSGYALLDPQGRHAARAAIDEGRARGLPVSVDAASAGPIADVGPTEVLARLRGVDVVLANEDEVAALGGEAAVRAVVGALVVKRGAAGSSWLSEGERIDVSAPAASVLDTTGAGDAFAAGFLAARLAGVAPGPSLAAGAALAAVAVTLPGGRAPLPV